MPLLLTGAGPPSASTGSVTTPQNSVAPAVTGTPTVGSTLTTTTGTWTNSPTSYTYQWYSGGTTVGTNANTYTLVSGDAGNYVFCLVTATNASGSGSASSNSVGPVTGGYSPSLDFSKASNSQYVALVF